MSGAGSAAAVGPTAAPAGASTRSRRRTGATFQSDPGDFAGMLATVASPATDREEPAKGPLAQGPPTRALDAGDVGRDAGRSGRRRAGAAPRPGAANNPGTVPPASAPDPGDRSTRSGSSDASTLFAGDHSEPPHAAPARNRSTGGEAVVPARGRLRHSDPGVRSLQSTGVADTVRAGAVTPSAGAVAPSAGGVPGGGEGAGVPAHQASKSDLPGSPAGSTPPTGTADTARDQPRGPATSTAGTGTGTWRGDGGGVRLAAVGMPSGPPARPERAGATQGLLVAPAAHREVAAPREELPPQVASVGGPAGGSATGAAAGATWPAESLSGPVARQLAVDLGLPWQGPDGTRGVSLQLQPEALGLVRVTVTVRAEQVQVELHPQSAVGHSAIEAGLPELERWLSSQSSTAVVTLHHPGDQRRAPPQPEQRRLDNAPGRPSGRRAGAEPGTGGEVPGGDGHLSLLL